MGDYTELGPDDSGHIASHQPWPSEGRENQLFQVLRVSGKPGHPVLRRKGDSGDTGGLSGLPHSSPQNWNPEQVGPWWFQLELRMAGWLALYLALKH